MKTITYDELFTRDAIERAVGDARLRHARRWLTGSDRMTRGFFLDLPVEKRIELVMEFVQKRAGWSPLIRVNIPKGAGKEGTRPICFSTTIDAVRLMIVADWLGEYAETVLTPQAVGCRHGRAMTNTIRAAVTMARKRDLCVVVVADIRGFFDSIRWRHLDRIVENLPADDAIKCQIQSAYQAKVLDRDTGEPVARSAGTPQGIAVSPNLANLVLHPLDVRLHRAVAPSGGDVLRYVDDVAVLAPNDQAARKARGVLRDQLAQLSLEIKKGTGEVIDLRDSGAAVRWLGVELRHYHGILVPAVPATTIAGQAANLRAEVESGLLSVEGVEDRINGLRRYYAQLVHAREATRAIGEIRALVLRDDHARKEVTFSR